MSVSPPRTEMTWSHRTHAHFLPAHPLQVSDDVFLSFTSLTPFPPTPTSRIRASASEPALSFVLKGLAVLTDAAACGKEVKMCEVKM